MLDIPTRFTHTPAYKRGLCRTLPLEGQTYSLKLRALSRSAIVMENINKQTPMQNATLGSRIPGLKAL